MSKTTKSKRSKSSAGKATKSLWESGVFLLSMEGDDASPHGPWLTLAGARDALRVLRASGEVSGQVRVLVSEGVYHLTGPVTFGCVDGNTTYAAAPGCTPIFDGGRELSGLREIRHRGRRAWSVTIPGAANGSLDVRSLFVDGRRRPRARFPKFSAGAEGSKNTLRIAEIRSPEKRGLFDGDHVFKPHADDIKDWPSLRDAEIVLLHYWVETRLPRPYLDPVTGWLTCERRSVFTLYESFNPKLARYYIDNLFEALDEPGEWYLSRRTGELIYLPHPEETLESTKLVIPVVTRFIDVAGNAFNRDTEPVMEPLGARLVEGLKFEGLIFRHADWYQPSASLPAHNMAANEAIRDVPLGSAVQAADHLPAAIRFRWSRGCEFSNNTVENIGFNALEIGCGCHQIRASRNTLHQLGGGGVKIGGAEVDGPPADRTSDIEFSDNRVLCVGRVFHQSCGIVLTCAYRCALVHNEVAHTCYTGISVGWTWGYRETITRGILIENNLIHDICEGTLSDNGGIYLLGVQPGTVVRGNHIYGVTSADYGGWGIYPDEGSSHMIFEHNWVHDTSGSAFSVHYGRELVLRHNVFARPGEAFVNVSRAEAHISATLLHNVFIGPARASFRGDYRGDILDAIASDANVFDWSSPDDVPPVIMPEYRSDMPRSRPFHEWQKNGHDRLSLLRAIATKETSSSLVFPKNSPALAAGFKPWDWSQCGPRPLPSTTST